MKVQVNNKEVEITPDSTLTQLTAQLELPVQGIAIAVNNKMIPRTEWEGFILHENDNLVIIKAAALPIEPHRHIRIYFYEMTPTRIELVLPP